MPIIKERLLAVQSYVSVRVQIPLAKDPMKRVLKTLIGLKRKHREYPLLTWVLGPPIETLKAYIALPPKGRDPLKFFKNSCAHLAVGMIFDLSPTKNLGGRVHTVARLIFEAVIGCEPRPDELERACRDVITGVTAARRRRTNNEEKTP